MSDSDSANFTFKAEIQQLLNILVHSLYTNKEIFLRELVSNASDALDKLRFEQSRGATVREPELPLEIRITTDKDKRLLTIADTGLGMTREELITNLGTIAHSGTAEFVRKLAEAGEGAKLDSVIGQFGVGFYSVYMVAENVAVTSRSALADEPAQIWRSDGQGTFSVEPAETAPARGTVITVTLKPEAAEFATPERLRATIKRHSGFVSFPVFVDGEQANTITALWREPKSAVTPEQYKEFYSYLTFDSEAPLETIHVAADAPIQFSSLLFIPPRELDPYGMQQGPHGLDLYVRRVLIQRENKDILPEYLGFVRGVVDSEDLPLNISRETLQENILLRKISQTLTKNVLAHLKKMAADDAERYATFWRTHGKLLRLGYADYANQETFAELLRFPSSAAPEALVPLSDYVSRLKDGQKDVYYISGQNIAALAKSPHLELFRKKGLEVLYLAEPIDEFVMEALRNYKDHPLTSVERVDPAGLAAFPDQEAATEAPAALTTDEQADFDRLLARMKTILEGKVTDVRASKRLKDSPVLLVSPEGGMTSSMQKIMRIMTKDESVPPKVLEVNPDHAITRNLLAIFHKHQEDDYLSLATQQLFEAALIQDGYLTDPQSLVSHIQDHLAKASSWYSERLK
jgi:molecular chaperone HtpG